MRARTRAHTHTHRHTHTQFYTHSHHTLTNTHTQTHTHTHTHTNTHKHTQRLSHKLYERAVALQRAGALPPRETCDLIVVDRSIDPVGGVCVCNGMCVVSACMCVSLSMCVYECVSVCVWVRSVIRCRHAFVPAPRARQP
jgi:hypothetical protein